MISKEKSLKRLTIYASYLLIFWGFYRLLFKLPDETEEIFVKPVFWLLPIFFLLRSEKERLQSLGLTVKNIFPSIYLSLGVGSLFIFEALIFNFIKHGELNFSANLGEMSIISSLILSFATAFTEELTFRGYIFNRLWKILGKEVPAVVISTALWTLIHVPIAIFVWKYPLLDTFVYLFLTTIFGIGSSIIFAKTGNILSSILLHILWEWPIILFR